MQSFLFFYSLYSCVSALVQNRMTVFLSCSVCFDCFLTSPGCGHTSPLLGRCTYRTHHTFVLLKTFWVVASLTFVQAGGSLCITIFWLAALADLCQEGPTFHMSSNWFGAPPAFFTVKVVPLEVGVWTFLIKVVFLLIVIVLAFCSGAICVRFSP